MPPRKQPQTLRDISLQSVARLANESCFNIEHKHGGFKCQASRDELDICKTYLLSVRYLFDEIRKLVLETFFDLFYCRNNWDSELARFRPRPLAEKGADDKYLILDLLMCDNARELNLRKLHDSNNCFTDSVFWKNQLLKLMNVVVLDIQDVRLTHTSFQAIGEVCTNLRKLDITSDRKYASMKSLKHVLKCQKLQEVYINFLGWSDNNRAKYVAMLVVGLPQLQFFDEWLYHCNMRNTKPFETPLTSMRRFSGRLDSEYLTELIRVCPNLTNLQLFVSCGCAAASGIHDQVKLLEVLEESSLKLTHLAICRADFHQGVLRVISSKGAHLVELEINVLGGRRISVNDVYAIGLGCPKIEELRFSEICCNVSARRRFIQRTCPEMEAKTFDTTPPMFTALKVLEVKTRIDWDQRILPLILRHADNITNISLRDVFKPATTSLDPLTQILNANALQELENLHIDARYYNDKTITIPFPTAPIERLLDSCHKLTKFVVMCKMEEETINYLKAKQSFFKSGNYDVTFEFFGVFNEEA